MGPGETLVLPTHPECRPTSLSVPSRWVANGGASLSPSSRISPTISSRVTRPTTHEGPGRDCAIFGNWSMGQPALTTPSAPG